MAEKSNQELQEEIDFLKGQVECLTGMVALQLSIYFRILKQTADGEIPASKIHEIDERQLLGDILAKRFDEIEEQGEAVREGFNQTKNHCPRLIQNQS